MGKNPSESAKTERDKVMILWILKITIEKTPSSWVLNTKTGISDNTPLKSLQCEERASHLKPTLWLGHFWRPRHPFPFHSCYQPFLWGDPNSQPPFACSKEGALNQICKAIHEPFTAFWQVTYELLWSWQKLKPEYPPAGFFPAARLWNVVLLKETNLLKLQKSYKKLLNRRKYSFCFRPEQCLFSGLQPTQKPPRVFVIHVHV